LRKLTASISRSQTMVIFINQIRMKIGVMYGSPETTTGGNALKFYASVRLDIRRIGSIKDREEVTGNQTRVKVVKNKVAPPFKQAEFDIIYGFGISREGGLIDMGVEHGFVRKAGAWYTYDGDQLGQGKENARSFLKDNPDLSDELEKKIKEKLGIGPRVDQTPEPVAAMPATAVPAKAGPSVKSVPIKNGPSVRNGSAKARSTKAAPTEAVPIKDMPIRDVPVDF
jgi:recombination protein RecA